MKIKKGFVLGAGIMGTGIAHLMAQKGVEAILVDIDDAILKSSIANIEKILNKRVEKGKMTADEVKDLLGRITTTTDMKAAAEADFVIEAVIEDVGLKQKLFAQLEEAAKPDAVLATNTRASRSWWPRFLERSRILPSGQETCAPPTGSTGSTASTSASASLTRSSGRVPGISKATSGRSGSPTSCGRRRCLT